MVNQGEMSCGLPRSNDAAAKFLPGHPVSCLWGPVLLPTTGAFGMPSTRHARLHPPPQPRRRQPHARARPAATPLGTYDRGTELPAILPLWRDELADDTPRGRRLILAKLRRALRAERRRGSAGHWTYDLARHAELLRVYRLELARYRTYRTHTGPDTGRAKNDKLTIRLLPTACTLLAIFCSLSPARVVRCC